ncbi:MAG: hypothetical protein QMD14_04945 [Candidatus Aenigmarchaeota archaeon]|nr:hypothetical protein [Candidatus Aenigmarchaeota archaeon]
MPELSPLAREKLAKIGEATQEERLEWKYVPKGQQLAASYLRGEVNIESELTNYEAGARSYVIKGLQETLLTNIVLPKDEHTKQRNRKAMEGIYILKENKGEVGRIFGELEEGLFKPYEQTKLQAYTQVKSNFEMKIQQTLQQQLGTLSSRVKIDVERQPQFQEELRKALAQLDSQYADALNKRKQEIKSIT